MPLLNFKKQFAAGVRASVDENFRVSSKVMPKRTTIRAMRKNPIKKGDNLYLYTGLRTKYAHKLGEAVCIKAESCRMRIDETGFVVEINNAVVSDERLTKIALSDGFKSVHEFRDFFIKEHSMPFLGQYITWKSTYNRKYYLNQQVKMQGFDLLLEETSKTILVPPEKTDIATKSKHVAELKEKYNYGVQFTVL